MQYLQIRQLTKSAIAIVSIVGASQAIAAPYQWTNEQIQGLTDVTAVYHGGAGQLSTINSITHIPNGLELNVTFQIGQETEPLGANYGLGFARVSLAGALGLDLSSSTSSSLRITTTTDLTAQSFLQADFAENGISVDDGDATLNETFSSVFWEHNDSIGVDSPTVVDFDFADADAYSSEWNVANPQPLQGANAIRGWGFQLAKFSGMTVGQPVQATIRLEGVQVEPPPPPPPPSDVPSIWNVAAGGNGHAYDFIPHDAITWEMAKSEAASRTFNGLRGHLATITSAEENAFIVGALDLTGAEAWLGGYQPNPASPAAEGWQWITGEPFNYTNWEMGEPNDTTGDEHQLGMWGTTGDGPRGTWNDQEYPVYGHDNIDGYIVEYELPLQQVVLAWGHDVPVLIEYKVVAGEDEYPTKSGTMSAYANATDSFKTMIRDRVQQQFVDSGINNIEVVNGDPEPGATVVYFTNPIGNLLGMAYTGIDRFNRRSSDEVAVMIQPAGDFGDAVEYNAETIAHEVGHSLGLRHIDPPGDIEVMDYDRVSGTLELFSNQPFPVKEPPGPNGKLKGYGHNPLYHIKRYVESASLTELESLGLAPGEWDLPGFDFTDWGYEFSFSVHGGGSPSTTTLFDAYVLASEGDDDTSRLLSFFPEITLTDLSEQSFRIYEGDALTLFASSAPGGLPDITLGTGDPFTSDHYVFPTLGTISALLQIVDGSVAGYQTLADVSLTTSVVLPGDYDGDRDVDGDDFLVWQRDLGSFVARGTGADGSANGVVDANDLEVWRTHFGDDLSTSTAVPEPSTAGLMAIAVVLASIARSRLCVRLPCVCQVHGVHRRSRGLTS